MARTRSELAAELTAQRLYELYVEQRLSFRAIARQIGCSDLTVAAAVRRLGLVRPPAPARPALDATTVKELARLYTEQGLDLRGVAARTGVARDRIAPELRQAGVRLRKRGARPADHLDPQQLRAQYEAGASVRALAVQEHTDDGAIRAALLKAGAQLRPAGGFRKWASVLTRDFLLQQYVHNGLTIRTIAANVGCSYDTVRAAMDEHNITVRYPGTNGTSERHRR